jgi:hypothetical protein
MGNVERVYRIGGWPGVGVHHLVERTYFGIRDWPWDIPYAPYLPPHVFFFDTCTKIKTEWEVTEEEDEATEVARLEKGGSTYTTVTILRKRYTPHFCKLDVLREFMSRWHGNHYRIGYWSLYSLHTGGKGPAIAWVLEYREYDKNDGKHEYWRLCRNGDVERRVYGSPGYPGFTYTDPNRFEKSLPSFFRGITFDDIDKYHLKKCC